MISYFSIFIPIDYDFEDRGWTYQKVLGAKNQKETKLLIFDGYYIALTTENYVER